MQWLRRSFVAGFFVTVPLFISVAAFIWIFNVVDGLTTPFYDRLLGRRIPGLGTASMTQGVKERIWILPEDLGERRAGASLASTSRSSTSRRTPLSGMRTNRTM